MKKVLCIYFIIISLSTKINIYAKDLKKKDYKSKYSDKIDFKNSRILKLSEIKKGMTGYGLSVFSGMKREKFNVEIISIIQWETAKSKVILARFSGANLEHTGVIAGMSGSPVYINNKLIGAVSHAFTNSKDPIGAIRPIEEMLPVLKVNKQKTSNERLKITPIKKVIKRYNNEIHNKNIYYKSNLLKPIATPIIFSKINNKSFNIIKNQFNKTNLFPVLQSIGYGNFNDSITNKISKDLMPGDAVGIPLIRGDINLTALGTVTYKKGNKVLIFGHPAFSQGPVSFPMSKEYVHLVIANRSLSFKLSSTLFNVGTIYNDQYSAVAGRIGKAPRSIPIKVRLNINNKENEYNYNVISDKNKINQLLNITILNSVFNQEGATSNTTVKVNFKIRVKNLKANKIDLIKINDFFTGDNTQKNIMQGLSRINLALQNIILNPFAKTKIVDINAKIDLSYGWRASEIIKFKILNKKIKAGDNISAIITLRNYKNNNVYKKVSIKIPDNINSNTLILNVASAKIENEVDKILSTSKFRAKNYKHLIEILNYEESFNNIVIWIDSPIRNGLVSEGFELSNLPSSIFSIINNESGIENNTIGNTVKKYYKTNYLIYGSVSSLIKIEN